MVDVSIIVPVWNAAGLLPRCLDSIVAQTWDHDRIEVLLVDDGSTDGSGAICDDYARAHRMFRVIHQENSGGPAAPRNRGIEAATGEFLFFCDNDDYFGAEAVERMVGHARAWESDVLLLKMGQSGGRDIPRRVFDEEQPKADVYASLVTSTLGPWKLYRRSLVIENAIRFPEDCSFDDSIFTLHAMLSATTVSVANDYEYYYWVLRSDGGNISTGGVDTAWHRMDRRIRGLQRLTKLVEELADPELAQLNILPKLFGEPTSATVRRIPYYEPADADHWAQQLRELVRPQYSRPVADKLRFDVQLMYAILLQTEDSEGLRNMIDSMPGVPRNTRFAEEGEAVYAEHVTLAEHPTLVRFEVGPTTLRSIMTAVNTLKTASWRDGTLTLSGELACVSGHAVIDPLLQVRLNDHQQPDRSVSAPVESVTRQQPAADGGRVVTTLIEWRCVVGRDLIESLPVSSGAAEATGFSRRWDFNLVVEADGGSRTVRLGADRDPGVFKHFASGAVASADRFFVPDETGMKNISIWEVTSDADLSVFRVKRGRPPENVELLTRLASHDFPGAMALARTIQAGRFHSSSGRARRIGRALVSRAKALRRKGIALIRRLLKQGGR